MVSTVAEGASVAETVKSFVTSILSSVTSTLTIADVAIIIGVILAAVLGIYFAWKFGRKGFGMIVGALTGRKPKM